MPISNILMQQAASIKYKHKWNLKSWEPALVTSSNYNFTSTTDGPTVIKYLSGLTINAGHTVTTSNRCKGLVLFINGDCTINGTLSMTARGAISVGDNLAIDYTDANFLVNPVNINNFDYKISAVGGAGASYVNVVGGAWARGTGRTGIAAGTTFACGGGASGGACASNGTARSGSGSAGTSYSGGSAGGGCGVGACAITAYSGTANGGVGGAGRSCQGGGTQYRTAGGGGAGNAGGAPYYTGGSSGTITAGSSGTGGLLILVVRGSLTIGSTGIISSNGSAGGYCSGVSESGGGGGSGGGSITTLYSKSYNNSGTLQANGGLGGSAPGSAGGPGGAGSIRINQISI